MNQKPIFTPVQKAAIRLINNDLRFLYTLVCHRQERKNNYTLSSMPYLGVIIDGVEDWLKSYNNSHEQKINITAFTTREQLFYEKMRSSIKLWENPYSVVFSEIESIYEENKSYFSSLCNDSIRKLELYDFLGIDFVDGYHCGNTILCSYYVPDYRYFREHGKDIINLSEIGGRYIVLFGATKEYSINSKMKFSCDDFGGINKSPVGNDFSDNFILYCLLL